MILVTAAVEHHFADSGSLGAIGNRFADDFGCCDVAAALQILFGFLVRGAGGNQRLARTVVNDLGVDVVKRAVHAKARTLLCARHSKANALVNAFPLGCSR